MTKPIRVWLVAPGPNPWKVVLILEELQIPYEIISMRSQETVIKPYIDVNPNGREPAIEDPNTGLFLWETGAIVLYLVEQYDTEKKLTYDTLVEKNLLNQWLIFQVSEQGRNYGRAACFHILYPDEAPPTTEDYANRAKGVCRFLERSLTGRDWLVGDKMTFADLAFVAWNDRLDLALKCEDEKKFEGLPMVQAWHERMTSRPAWKKAMEIKAKLLDEKGLGRDGMPKGISNITEFRQRMQNDEAAAKK